ncbi:MAG: deoxyuridine 5'-triphosphate nucleotidohydrolase [Lachnospiraceae bacterium]|nr:deoxyuridine 5'-triphosphate nucleotidohydrolase [Lachnospiraceae bacterium]
MDRIAEFDRVSIDQFKKDYGEDLKPNDLKDIYFNVVRLPLRSTSGSAGYDFYSTKPIKLAPGETITIPTGLRCKIDDGWFLMLAPRSGLGFKYRLQLDNTIGIIDSDYYGAENEGHIMIRVTNDSKSGKILDLELGTKFAQGIFVPYGITIDDEANDVRTGGFGSTGV